MAPSTIFSLIILRRLSFLRTIPRSSLSHPSSPKHFSVQPSASSTSPDAKPTSLSARFSFVFDQIDAIERESSQKDDTLQRIRAWRESKKSKLNQDEKETVAGDVKPVEPSFVGVDPDVKEVSGETVGLLSKEVEVVHPWPEWIELMERLVQQNYFDHRRKDEERMVKDLGFPVPEVAGEGFDFTRDWRTVQTACLNFGKDRFDILRSLSRQDIQTLVGYGCPSSDKKVVFSAKLLRKHVHLNEGDVCSSCSLRSSCERGFLVTNKEDEARTIDVMRILLTYGFDPLNGSVVNDMLLKKKSVKTVVRKLLHEVVKLSAVPIDPNLPPPVIRKPPPKVKIPPPPPRKRVGRDDIEMKKGDWLCPKCDFMNFAKNTVCLQCDAKRPQRQLLPGEWECPQCNFLNYRRNTVCFHCEHKRPPDEFMENQQDRHRGPNPRPEKMPNRDEVSNAWNFDFDDNESDGADVAAFEYADSRKLDEDFPLHNDSQRENFKGPGDDSYTSRRTPRVQEQETYDHGQRKPQTGFDDFDDEDDDDVDSYEVDTQNDNQLQKGPSIDFSDVEGPSDSEDVEDFEDGRIARPRSSWSRDKPSKTNPRKSANKSVSDVGGIDFDSDDDLPVHNSWKSSHVADLGSDEDFGLGSDSDDSADSNFSSRKNKGDSDRGSRKRRSFDSEDESLSELDSDEDGGSSFSNRSSRGGGSRGRGGDNQFSSGSRFGSNGRRSTGNDFNRSRGNNKGFEDDDYGERRSREGNSRNFSGGGRFENKRGGRKPSGGSFERSSSQGSRGNSRGFDRDDDFGERRMSHREGNSRNSSDRFDDRRGGRRPSGNSFSRSSQGSRGGRFGGGGGGGRGSSNSSYNRSGMDSDHYDDDRPRSERVNVR